MEPKSQDWHRADIKSALEKEVLRSEIFLVRPVYHLIHCTMSLPVRPRAERIIADALGITPKEIWPSRYDDMQIKNDADTAE